MLAVYKHFVLTELSKPGQKYQHKSDYKASFTAAGTGSAKGIKRITFYNVSFPFFFSGEVFGRKYTESLPYCTSANP